MGMSIDETIKEIETIKSAIEWDYPLEYQIVLDGAIDTMRKYQKIKRIIKAVDDRNIGYATMMDALHKVVEDGEKED